MPIVCTNEQPVLMAPAVPRSNERTDLLSPFGALQGSAVIGTWSDVVRSSGR